MPEFKDMKSLLANLQKAITETLQDEVKEVIISTLEIETMDKVYSVYDPSVYERRFSDGGLLDRENIKSELISDEMIAIYNDTPPNPNATGGATTDKNLPELIEFGHGYNENYYDYPRDKYPFMKPRPFIEGTREALRTTGAHKKALKEGLKKRGFDVT